jgi:cell division septation protein DedD
VTAAAPPAPKPAAPAPAPKAAIAAAAPAPKPPPKAPTAPTAAKPGAAAVQIGAVASPSLADKTWNDAVAVAPGLAAGKGKGVEPVEKDGKTLYRTSVTGFASREAAQAFCAKLKAAGKACFVK